MPNVNLIRFRRPSREDIYHHHIGGKALDGVRFFRY